MLLVQLQSMLDTSIEINCIMMEYLKIWLEMLKDKTNVPQDMPKLEKLLPFKISEVGNYKYIVKHERLILTTYIAFMGILKKYESIPCYKNMTVWEEDDLFKKLFAGIFENLSSRYANFYGNVGNYAESNEIADDGIRIELECERMQSLNTMLYCIAWNDGKQQKITNDSINLCKWAYELAKFKRMNSQMNIYENWLKAIKII